MSGLGAVVLSALALLPGFKPFAAGPAGGELYRGVIPDQAAPQPLQPGYVYLPPGFSPAARYPVLYLLHGMPGTPGEYVFSLRLAQTADSLIATRAVRPFVAVVPAAGDVHYDGEWAGPWERYLVDGVVPWVRSHLPVRGSILAGLSAGGFGAVDIALRHPKLFSRVESWGGYFQPLRDGPLKYADPATLEANDPRLVARAVGPTLRADRTSFLLTSGPAHGRVTTPAATVDFARELRSLHVPATLDLTTRRAGMWQWQFRTGLLWALGLRSPLVGGA
jgi:S-formylglutathione hydrolase FrmB